MTMTPEELKAKLDAHKLWLETRESDEVKGERLALACANLRGAHLTGADLTGADLSYAHLTGAHLSCANLRGAYLRGANLRGADLRGAYLRGAHLSYANLRGADLSCAHLRGADLRGANLDYSAWPLWCGSLNVKSDKRLAAQLMYHAMRAMQSCSGDADVAAVLARPECVALANQFHHVDECGPIEVFGK